MKPAVGCIRDAFGENISEDVLNTVSVICSAEI